LRSSRFEPEVDFDFRHKMRSRAFGAFTSITAGEMRRTEEYDASKTIGEMLCHERLQTRRPTKLARDAG